MMLQKMKTLPTVNTFYVNSLYVSTARIRAGIHAGPFGQQACAGPGRDAYPSSQAKKPRLKDPKGYLKTRQKASGFM